MSINTNCRTEEPEIMDDFDMEGDVLREALDKIAAINRFLGGNNITIDGITEVLSNQDKSKIFTIIDIGCGNGDMLRKIADFGVQNNFKFHLKGIDANQYTVNYAKKLSVLYPNIVYSCVNIFDKSFQDLKYDIALLTLTLHHFSDDQIKSFLSKTHQNCTVGIVVNDLQRSKLSYRLFQVLAVVCKLNKMSTKDGLISILRGFKKQDLIVYSEQLHFKKYAIRWKWAFRYQWIILK